MRQLILGTAGHIDHGKTALVHALTGIDTDRLPEEKRRGITIDLGFADLTLDSDVHVGIIDVPGHENFVRNMLAGATGIDLGLLVVAADEGVMPQTREHLAILELLGVRDLVVAMTKSDLAEPEWRELVADDIDQLLADSRFEGAPVLPVSAREGTGLDTLRQALAERAGRIGSRDADDLLRLPIDRVFTVRGTGTVVTGTLWSGSVTRDQNVQILAGGRKARIRAIQTHGRERDSAVAGERTALALAGVDRDQLSRGDVLVADAGWEPARIVTARLRILESAAPVRRGQRIRFHLGTAEVAGRVVPFGGTTIQPGTEDDVQVRLEQPVVARAGDRFVIRAWSPVATIGGGRVSEPAARRRKRITSAVAGRLADILDGTPADAINAAAALAGWTGLATGRLSVRTPLRPAAASAALQTADVRVTALGNRLYHDDMLAQGADRIVRTLREFHEANPIAPGLSREQLRQAVPAPDPAVADYALNTLTDAGTIDASGSLASLADHAPALTARQAEICDELVAAYADAGLASPTTGDLPPHLADHPDFQDLIHHLARTGRLVTLAPGRHISAEAAADAVARVRAHLRGRTGLGPGDFRDLFGVSRKFLLPLLGWLDRTGVTVRIGELRSVPPLEASPEEKGP